MSELSIREMSKRATQIKKNEPKSVVPMEELQDMYSNRVMMADFISAKGIPVKCKAHKNAKLDGSDFSSSYQRLAAEQGLSTAFTRSCTGNLLWDLDFLNDNLEAVKEIFLKDIRVDLFGPQG